MNTIPISMSFSSSRFIHCCRTICYSFLPSPCCSLSLISNTLKPPPLNFETNRMTNLTCFSSAVEGPITTSSMGSIQPKPKPWLIVGLGNPGRKYTGTRHNVGFELVEATAAAEEISMSSVSFKASFGKGCIGNVPVLLSKPQTFMNVSGESVGPMVSYYKIPLKQVLLIYDDLDLPFAKLRLLPKGGHGGHNGN